MSDSRPVSCRIPPLTDRLKGLLDPDNVRLSVPSPFPAAIPADPALAWVPAGHFYSPILSADDRRRATRVRELPREIPGVDLHEDAQLALLEKMPPLYESLHFTAAPDPARRYHYENTFYSYSDAVHYALMLLHHQPRRVIEVGSGYSSALLLDIAEQTASDRPIDMTFIEPYPDELAALARPGDLDGRLVQSGVQDVDLSQFIGLEAGDFLFIDSTHVAKAGSDVNYLYFEVLPRLASGVFVHVMTSSTRSNIRASGSMRGAAGTRLTCCARSCSTTTTSRSFCSTRSCRAFMNPGMPRRCRCA